MLTRLVYSSLETRPLDKSDIDQILEASRRNNLVDGVTGMLCYGNRRFLQYLEGPSDAVNAIYRKIAKDDRHAQLNLADESKLERRTFGDWSMGYIDVDNILTSIMLKEVTKQNEFMPEKMDLATNLRLINKLKSSLGDQTIID